MDIKSIRPLKMFIYHPLFLKGKYVRSTVTKFPYFRVEIGDVFVSEKRPATFALMKEQEESKVESVRYNLAGGGECLVFLEKKEFANKADLDRFVSGKQSV